MSVGRTSWFSMDGAWQRREFQLDLGEEFGAPGIAAMIVMWMWAQEQIRFVEDEGGRRGPATGEIQGGFRQLRREAFLESDEQARAIVQHAAKIGALKEFEMHEDGRRFFGVVAGFAADQERGGEALKKRDQRSGARRGKSSPNGTRPPAEGHVPQGDAKGGHVLAVSNDSAETASEDAPAGNRRRRRSNRPDISQNADPGEQRESEDVVPAEGDMSPLPNLTNTNNVNNSFVDASHDEEESTQVEDGDRPTIEPGPHAQRLSQLLADLILERAPNADVRPLSKKWLDAMRLLLAKQRDAAEVERVLRWSQADSFWSNNILSAPTFREKFTQLQLKSKEEAPAGRSRRSPGQQPSAAPTAMPCTPADAGSDADVAWQDVATQLRERMGDQFDVWLSDGHAHSLDGPPGAKQLRVGTRPEAVRWASARLTKLADAIGKEIGCTIEFVACKGEARAQAA